MIQIGDIVLIKSPIPGLKRIARVEAILDNGNVRAVLWLQKKHKFSSKRNSYHWSSVTTT